MTQKYILIGSENIDCLLCSVTSVQDEKILFYVINGDWYGTFDAGTVLVNKTGVKYNSQKILWKGDKLPSCDYNEAIRIILKEILKDE